MSKKKQRKLTSAKFLLTLQIEISKIYHLENTNPLECVSGLYEEVFAKVCNAFGFPRHKSYCKVKVTSSELAYIVDLHSKIQKFIGMPALTVTLLSKDQLYVLAPETKQLPTDEEELGRAINLTGRQLDSIAIEAQAKVNHCKTDDDLDEVISDILVSLVALDYFELVHVEWEDAIGTDQLAIQTKGLASKHVIIVPEDLACHADIATMNALLASQINRIKQGQQDFYNEMVNSKD